MKYQKYSKVVFIDGKEKCVGEIIRIGKTRYDIRGIDGFMHRDIEERQIKHKIVKK